MGKQDILVKRKYYGSKYKYVCNLKYKDKDYWTMTFMGVTRKRYETERLAAIAVDKYLISKGKPPVNILVQK